MDSTTAQPYAIALARLEVEVTYLKAAVARLDTLNTAQNEKLDRVLDQLAQARGGWRTLMLVGGAASSIGAGAAWLLSHLRG